MKFSFLVVSLLSVVLGGSVIQADDVDEGSTLTKVRPLWIELIRWIDNNFLRLANKLLYLCFAIITTCD